ncbi:ATP synthase subunit d [Cricetulus griseus]|nr:ATP synthase subunit d [Cricetulus griseus]
MPSSGVLIWAQHETCDFHISWTTENLFQSIAATLLTQLSLTTGLCTSIECLPEIPSLQCTQQVQQFEECQDPGTRFTLDSPASPEGRIQEYETQLKIKNIIPFGQMTIDDLNEFFPETKLEKKKYAYWPHQPIKNL